MSTAATPSQAKGIYVEPKLRMCERVHANLNSFGAIADTIGSGKDKHQAVVNVTYNFGGMEKRIEETHENLKKLSLLHIHMSYQQEAIGKMAQNLETLKEQAQSMRR